MPSKKLKALRVSPDTITITLKGIERPVLLTGEANAFIESIILECLGLKSKHLWRRRRNTTEYINKRRGIYLQYGRTTAITFHGKFWTNKTAWKSFSKILGSLVKSGLPVTLSRIDVCVDFVCPIERLYSYRHNNANPLEHISKSTVFQPIYKVGEEPFNRRVFIENNAFALRIYRKDIEVRERYETRNKKGKHNKHDAKNKFYYDSYQPYFANGVSRVEVKYGYSRASRMFSVNDISIALNWSFVSLFLVTFVIGT